MSAAASNARKAKGKESQEAAAKRARSRRASFDILLRNLAEHAPELLAAKRAGPILEDLAAAVNLGEWNSAVGRLVEWALRDAARGGEKRLTPQFIVVVGRLRQLIANGFIPRTGKPSSAFNAQHDAMIIQAAEALTVPQAVAALDRWERRDAASELTPVSDQKVYNSLRGRALRAAAAAGIELLPGEAFRGDVHASETKT